MFQCSKNDYGVHVSFAGCRSYSLSFWVPWLSGGESFDICVFCCQMRFSNVFRGNESVSADQGRLMLEDPAET